MGERSEPRQGEELCFGVALLFGGEPCGLVGGRGWSEHQGTGRVPPKWSPWLFSFDVIRNTTSPKSFLLVRHESLCPLATLCMACVRFIQKPSTSTETLRVTFTLWETPELVHPSFRTRPEAGSYFLRSPSELEAKPRPKPRVERKAHPSELVPSFAWGRIWFPVPTSPRRKLREGEIRDLCRSRAAQNRAGDPAWLARPSCRCGEIQRRNSQS